MSLFSKLTGRSSSPAPVARSVRPGRSVEVPTMGVTIDRKQYAATDLTVRSFRISPYDGDLIAKQKFAFTFVVPRDDGKEEQIPCQGIVRHIDQNGLLALYRQPQPFYQQILINHIARIQSALMQARRG